MQQIVLETPYRFVPPTRGRIWPAILAGIVGPYMRRNYGVHSCEVRGADKVRASIDAGCGIVCPGNHSRPCDPMACGWLTRAVHHPYFCMASWHTFMGSKVERFLIRRCGAYSIYREGTDHASLNFTVDALVNAERPIMIFAEGAVTRVNNFIAPLLEGTTLIARMAARRGAKQSPPRPIVVHPVVYKYFFEGDLERVVAPVLDRLEPLLKLPRQEGPALTRVRRLEDALLARFERQYLGGSQRADGDPVVGDRPSRLVEHIVAPLEAEWKLTPAPGRGDFVRIQALRSRILPDIVAGTVSGEELARRRKQLADLYNAQIINTHPRHSLEGEQEPERIIEAVERIEEDLRDKISPLGPRHLVIEAGEAIEVSPERQRGAEDPLTPLIHKRLTELLQAAKRP
jgi:hypothetical protein